MRNPVMVLVFLFWSLDINVLGVLLASKLSAVCCWYSESVGSQCIKKIFDMKFLSQVWPRCKLGTLGIQRASSWQLLGCWPVEVDVTYVHVSSPWIWMCPSLTTCGWYWIFKGKLKVTLALTPLEKWGMKSYLLCREINWADYQMQILPNDSINRI